MAQTFPTPAQIVIIGGSVIGTSTAYNLIKQGACDVLLLEKPCFPKVQHGTPPVLSGNSDHNKTRCKQCPIPSR